VFVAAMTAMATPPYRGFRQHFSTQMMGGCGGVGEKATKRMTKLAQ
jgi:hypothetical protein